MGYEGRRLKQRVGRVLERGRGRDGVMMVSEDVMKSLGRRGGKSDATWSCWGEGSGVLIPLSHFGSPSYKWASAGAQG